MRPIFRSWIHEPAVHSSEHEVTVRPTISPVAARTDVSVSGTYASAWKSRT